MIPPLLLEIDLSAPTALGIPLGLLLLIWILYMNMQQQQGGKRVSRPGQSPATSHISPNTMDVAIDGEVSPDVVLFQHSEAGFVGGECTIHFTVKLKQQGTFVVAGGKVSSRRFSRAYYGTRKVSGDVGDVISGAVRCAVFTTGIWGIGAFRSSGDVPVG